MFYEPLLLLRSLFFFLYSIAIRKVNLNTQTMDCVWEQFGLEYYIVQYSMLWVAGIRHWHVMLRYVSIWCCHHCRCRRRHHLSSLSLFRFASFIFSSLPMQTSIHTQRHTHTKSDDAKANNHPTHIVLLSTHIFSWHINLWKCVHSHRLKHSIFLWWNQIQQLFTSIWSW